MDKTAVATLFGERPAGGHDADCPDGSDVFSFEDTFDVGEDSASPVGDYESPFAFTGTIQRIDLDFAPSN